MKIHKEFQSKHSIELGRHPSLYQLEGNSPKGMTREDNGQEKDDKVQSKNEEPNIKTKSRNEPARVNHRRASDNTIEYVSKQA